MKKWLDKPNTEGWWFCSPAPDSEWFEMYKEGLVVRVSRDECAQEGDLEDGFSAQLSLAGDYVGFSGQYAGDIKGRWFGPLDLWSCLRSK